MLFAPPGLTYLRAPDDGWHLPVHRLIARAHTIFLLLPDLPIGQGLEWEVSAIARLGLRSRVIFVLPPPEKGENEDCPTVHRMCDLMSLLKNGPRASRADLRYQALDFLDHIEGSVLVARMKEWGAPEIWVVVSDPATREGWDGAKLAKKSVCATGSYFPALVESFRRNCQDLDSSGFRECYADRSLQESDLAGNNHAGERITDECFICGKPAALRAGVRRRKSSTLLIVAIFSGCIVMLVVARILDVNWM